MFRDHTEDINRYYEYLGDEFQHIQSLDCGQYLYFKKLLYCSMIDVISRAIFTGKNRFTKVIEKFGKWDDYNRVSLPHLKRVLHLTPDPDFEDIREYVNKELLDWKAKWNEISIKNDPQIEQVSKLWPRGKEYIQLTSRVSLRSLTHINLLYMHRNFLVHELRNPGHGMEYNGLGYPYYQSVSTIHNEIDPIDESMELVYPVRFFENLILNIIRESKDYFIRNNLNPFHYYNFGSYWIEAMN